MSLKTNYSTWTEKGRTQTNMRLVAELQQRNQLFTKFYDNIYSLFFFFFGLFRAEPAAYGGSQARGPIGG